MRGQSKPGLQAWIPGMDCRDGLQGLYSIPWIPGPGLNSLDSSWWGSPGYTMQVDLVLVCLSPLSWKLNGTPDKSGSLVHLHPVYSHVTQFIEIIELYNEPGHAWSIPKSCSLVINPLFRSLSCDEPCCTIIDGLSLVTNHAITAGLAMSHHYCRSGHVTCHTQPSSFAQAESARAPNL